MPAEAYFTRQLFTFLTQLRKNNNREWFQRNKERYETEVRDPMLRFIAALGPGLRKIDPRIVADPSPNDGSMMRIYRDIRFSKDKTPYKTAVAAHFGPANGKGDDWSGYYLHLMPGDCMLGAGIWHPEPRVQTKIRDAIVADPKRWQRATSSAKLGRICEMHGESLQRPPRGYDPDHPLIEDLKRRDFTLGRTLTEAQVLSPDFLKLTLETYRGMAPFVEMLNEAVGRSR